ncbi:hypothetical protein PBAL39_21875 [Pedobacter sp. BAL39]|nr:hypothetical protein PBAL39_21875 [Pedobacter sp. BAL39]
MTNVGISNGLKISSVSFDLIYLIQVKRIAMGFSQSELSFLIGRGKGFIHEREAFKLNRELWMSDLFTMTKIFKCNITDFAGPEKQKSVVMRLLANQKITRNRISYEVYRIGGQGAPELVYRISEIDPAKKFTEKTQQHLLIKTRMLLLLVIDSGFFDHTSRRPLDIFLECQTQGGAWVKPHFVAEALNYWTISANQPLLKKRKHKMLGFIYEGISTLEFVKDQPL